MVFQVAANIALGKLTLNAAYLIFFTCLVTSYISGDFTNHWQAL